MWPCLQCGLCIQIDLGIVSGPLQTVAMVHLHLSGVVPPWWILFCFPRFEDTCTRHQCCLVSDSWKSFCGSVLFWFFFWASFFLLPCFLCSHVVISVLSTPPYPVVRSITSGVTNYLDPPVGGNKDEHGLSPRYLLFPSSELHLSCSLEALTALLASCSSCLDAEILTHFDICPCGEQ